MNFLLLAADFVALKKEREMIFRSNTAPLRYASFDNFPRSKKTVSCKKVPAHLAALSFFHPRFIKTHGKSKRPTPIKRSAPPFIGSYQNSAQRTVCAVDNCSDGPVASRGAAEFFVVVVFVLHQPGRGTKNSNFATISLLRKTMG